MSDESEPLSLSDKRRAAANARWENVAHPLFLYEPGEKAESIAFINIRRYGVNGPVDHQRVWPAVELQCEDDIFAFFGGGVYELIGRKGLPNGQPGNIVRKRRLTLDGSPKPFVGDAQAPPHIAGATAAVQQGPDPMSGLLVMMADERRERRVEEQRREEREAARSAQMTQLLVGALGTLASIVTAVLTRPQPVPQPMPDIAGTFQAGMAAMASVLPKPDQTDPLDRVAKILEMAKQIKPEDKGESVGDFMQGIGQAMSGFAQVEGMRIEAAKAGLMPGQPTPGAEPTQPATQANGNAPPQTPIQIDQTEAASLAS